MIARVTLGPTLLLLFCTTGAFAQETAAGEASKWMLGITFPHKAPDYFNFSDNGTDGSVGFNDSESTPTRDNNDRAHPRPISLDFAYRVEGGVVRLRVRFVIAARMARVHKHVKSSWELTSSDRTNQSRFPS